MQKIWRTFGRTQFGQANLDLIDATRSDLLPDIPIIAEFVPGYESSPWFGIGVPRNTPAAIVDKLNTEINALLADPTVKAPAPLSEPWTFNLHVPYCLMTLAI